MIIYIKLIDATTQKFQMQLKTMMQFEMTNYMTVELNYQLQITPKRCPSLAISVLSFSYKTSNSVVTAARAVCVRFRMSVELQEMLGVQGTMALYP